MHLKFYVYYNWLGQDILVSSHDNLYFAEEEAAKQNFIWEAVRLHHFVVVPGILAQ